MIFHAIPEESESVEPADAGVFCRNRSADWPGAFSLFEVSAERNHVSQLRDNWLPSARSSLQTQSGLRDIRLGEYRLAISQTPVENLEADTRIEAGIAIYRRAVAEYRNSSQSRMRELLPRMSRR